MRQSKTIMEVSELLDTFCEDCFLHAYLKKEQGKCKAHKFCIKECTVGLKLKEYGKMLS
ncbi:zinc-finger domain-containing protein [Bacillus pinisoli]|uniref:zinc-finger domain-containing protein n=1 Tax=Bacillus pinisoli TaxID=2901866 RepID=UPI001FF40ACC|nr:zinc-finger domain-containing protein [Bacillus pinisoli]